MLDICHVCRIERAVIHIEDDADYCPECFRRMLMKELGDKNVFDYSKYITVREDGGMLHSFLVTHKTVGQMPVWEATEQGGDYCFSHLSYEDDNGTDVVCEFLNIILRGVSSKTLRYLDPNKLRARLADKGTIGIADSNDSMMEISFVIDGESFSGHEFVKLLAGYEGFNMRYQIHEPTDRFLGEDEYLMPVIITKDSLIKELESIIGRYSSGNQIESNFIPDFENDFGIIITKLKLFLDGEKRREAVDTGKEMMRILNGVRSDNISFPANVIKRLEMMIFPYGNDGRDNY